MDPRLSVAKSGAGDYGCSSSAFMSRTSVSGRSVSRTRLRGSDFRTGTGPRTCQVSNVPSVERAKCRTCQVSNVPSIERAKYRTCQVSNVPSIERAKYRTCQVSNVPSIDIERAKDQAQARRQPPPLPKSTLRQGHWSIGRRACGPVIPEPIVASQSHGEAARSSTLQLCTGTKYK